MVFKIKTFFLKSNISGILGLKILLKGRVNGFSRSSIKGFSLGKLPISSFSSNISYWIISFLRINL